MRRKSHPSETPLGRSTRVSGILFDSFLATWSLLVTGILRAWRELGVRKNPRGKEECPNWNAYPYKRKTGRVKSLQNHVSDYATKSGVADQFRSPHLSLNALAGHTHDDTWDRGEFRYRLASIFVRTVPFATTQERTDELPPAVVAMDTIAAMEGHRELAIPPAFVNVVGNCPRHTRETLLGQACACGD
jgi:hypothetical protein